MAARGSVRRAARATGVRLPFRLWVRCWLDSRVRRMNGESLSSVRGRGERRRADDGRGAGLGSDLAEAVEVDCSARGFARRFAGVAIERLARTGGLDAQQPSAFGCDEEGVGAAARR